MESIAKRRAMINEAWDFYPMICPLLHDRRKYDDIFRGKMQLDPIYPCLRSSMAGLARRTLSRRSRQNTKA